jgi:hypothetical protein
MALLTAHTHCMCVFTHFNCLDKAVFAERVWCQCEVHQLEEPPLPMAKLSKTMQLLLGLIFFTCMGIGEQCTVTHSILSTTIAVVIDACELMYSFIV